MAYPQAGTGHQRFYQPQHGATHYDPGQKVYRGLVLNFTKSFYMVVDGVHLMSPYSVETNPSGRAYYLAHNLGASISLTEEQVLALLGE